MVENRQVDPVEFQKQLCEEQMDLDDTLNWQLHDIDVLQIEQSNVEALVEH